MSFLQANIGRTRVRAVPLTDIIGSLRHEHEYLVEKYAGRCGTTGLVRFMERRFYLPPPWSGSELILEGNEAHHLVRVLRLQAGEQVTVFDGQGRESTAQIAAVSREQAVLQLRGELHELPPPRRPLVLGSAVPKGERFDWLIEKAVELGVERLVPLVTERSVVEPGQTKIERLQRMIVAAAKQCGRSRLMQLDPPTRWHDFVQRGFAGCDAYLADPGGEAWSGPGPIVQPVARAVVVAVGPEGGFTPAEIAEARAAGGRVIRLGTPILRIETAALALAAVFAIGGMAREHPEGGL